MRDSPFLFDPMSSVSERAVRAAKVRSLQRSRCQRSSGPSIDVDAEPGDLGGDRPSALGDGAADEHVIEVRPRSVVALFLPTTSRTHTT